MVWRDFGGFGVLEGLVLGGLRSVWCLRGFGW